MTPAHKQKYVDEIARLDAEHTDLSQLWSGVPWFALLALLAPLAGYFGGWGGALVELMVTAALLGTRAYLISVRISENRWTRGRLLDDVQAEEGLHAA